MSSFIRVCLLVLAVVAGFSSTAHAMADYRVWYFDDNFDTFNEGDVTDGYTKLIPPAWACGILFYDPSYYRWVNSNGNNIGDGNFNKDVRVWLGKPGCSESLGIEYSDDSQSFPHVVGGSYMEISTHYGFSWINDDGGWPFCDDCVGPDELTYFPDHIDWAHIVASEFMTVKPSLLDGRLRSHSIKAIEQLGKNVAALFPAASCRGRQAPLGPSARGSRTLGSCARRCRAHQSLPGDPAGVRLPCAGEARALRGRVCGLHGRRRTSGCGRLAGSFGAVHVPAASSLSRPPSLSI